MARNTTEANVIVTLNGQTAREELSKLEKQMKSYRDAAQQAYTQGNKALGDEMAKKAERLEKEFKVATKEMKDFSDTIKNINSKTINELKSAAKQLERQIKSLSPTSQEFIDKSKQLQQVKERIKSLEASWKSMNNEQRKGAVSLKDLADGFNKYFGMVTAGIAAVTGVSMAFRKCAEQAAQLDDTYADVMKTTGLMHEEVADLDKELMKIDTRTSREQLLLLARDAGKLGIQGKDNILGFVRAADQIQVALGEDLGEGAIRNLGKIADVLGYTKSMGIESAMLSIGSAVNAVGQASTASEAYLVEFTQRLAGVGAQAGISAADLIGFASGLDQSAMKVEMASTAFQKFLMKMYEDPAQFASYAKMEVQQFTDLLNNDANTAITTVLKSLKDQDGFAAMVPIFKDMGLDGARAVSVLASMASNLDAVTEAQQLANLEFAKATSLTEEYNTKNDNLQAQLEKARKEYQNASIALGQSLNPIMLKSTKAVTYLIKALANYGKEIKTVLIVIAALTVALKAKVIWLKIVATWNATIKAGSLALAAAQALLTGNITRATAAWTMMNTAMKASVFGLVAAAISGLIIWLQRLNKETDNLTKLEKFEKQLHEDVANAVSDEAAKVKALRAILEDSNQSYDDRKKALEELKEIVPEYHANLSEEGVLINNNVDALNKYVDAMLQAAKTQVLQDKLMENANKQFQENEYLLEHAPEEFRDAMGEWRYSYDEVLSRGNGTYGTITHWIDQDCADAITRLKEFKEEEEVILKMIEEAGKKTVTDQQPKGGGGGGGGMDPKEAKKAFDARIKTIQEEYKQEEKELTLSLKRKQITEAEYENSLYYLKAAYFQDKLNAARKYGQDETEIWSEYYDWQIKLIDKHEKEVEEIEKRFEKIRRNRKKKESQEEKKQLQAEAKSRQREQQILEENLAVAKSRIANEHWKQEYDFEKWKLKQLHNLGWLTEKSYQESLLALRMEYAEKGAERLGKIASATSDFVTALKDAESAKLEAQYQKDLSAAGDNAEKREQIEADYEQKKLDLSKKYADADMAISIAKTVANGAAAAIRAIADSGWIAGGIIAALIAATTAAEVATIVQQRNAIKATTLSNASSGGSSLQNGQRVVTGYAEGGYTENHTTLTTVGEKGVEFVAPHWMVKENPVLFANLENYRKSRSQGRSGSQERGFADGGFSGKAPSPTQEAKALTMADIEEAVEAAMSKAMQNGKLRAVVQYGDILIAEDKNKYFKKQTSR